MIRAIGFLALLITLPSAAIGAVAHFAADFNSPVAIAQGQPRSTGGDGWDYLWNSAGAVGTAANYTSMLKTSGAVYTTNGNPAPDMTTPGYYVQFNAAGGHPGKGAQDPSNPGLVDRYAIAAYTVQAGESGWLTLTDSSIRINSFSSNGMMVDVYVNDTKIGSTLVQPGGVAASNFNRVLGNLNAGDTVYVAFGPNLKDGSDGFSHGYTIDVIRERQWDADGTGAVDGGAGTWTVADARWAEPNAGTIGGWSNTAGQSANFGGTAGSVTLAENITARSLIFSTGGYRLEGAGTITLTSAESGGAGPATISVVNAGDTATIDARLLGASGLTKAGDGTLLLANAANGYTGTTTVNAGTLRIGAQGALPNNLAINIAALANNGSTLDLAGTNYTALSLTMTGGTVQTGAGTLTSTANAATVSSSPYFDASTATIAGKLAVPTTTYRFDVANNRAALDVEASADISGAAGGVYKNGAGTLLLSALNSSYTGGTTVRQGTLLVGGTATAGQNGPLGNSSAAVAVGDSASSGDRALMTYGAANIGRAVAVNDFAGVPTLGGFTADNSQFSGTVTLNKSALVAPAAGGRVDFQGAIVGSGSLAIMGAGAARVSNSANSSAATSASGRGRCWSGPTVPRPATVRWAPAAARCWSATPCERSPPLGRPPPAALAASPLMPPAASTARGRSSPPPPRWTTLLSI